MLPTIAEPVRVPRERSSLLLRTRTFFRLQRKKWRSRPGDDCLPSRLQPASSFCMLRRRLEGGGCEYVTSSFIGFADERLGS